MNKTYLSVREDFYVLSNEWSEVFPHLNPLDYFCDDVLSFLLQRICFDIVKFDKELRWRFQYDAKKEISLKDFVESKYGSKASDLILKLITQK